MRMRQWMSSVAAIVLVAGFGAGCASDRPCKTVEPLRGDTRPWPNFRDSETFLHVWFDGNVDSLERTVQGVVSSTYCDAVNFPAALERFWFLIR